MSILKIFMLLCLINILNSTLVASGEISEVNKNTFYFQNKTQDMEMLVNGLTSQIWTNSEFSHAVTFQITKICWNASYFTNLNNNPLISQSSNAVKYQYDDVDIEYLMNAGGIKQNIYLNNNHGYNKGVKLEIQIGNNQHYILKDGVITFYKESEDGGNEIFKYSGLTVFDANGINIPSQITIKDNYIYLEIDDRNATYPILIDPISTVYSWTATGGQTSAQFGKSVANAGDVFGDGYSDIIIGAPLFSNDLINEGKVFLYNVTADGIPATPTWTCEGNQAGARIGDKVNSAGDVNGDGYDDIFIGAFFFNDQAVDDGAAFVYFGSPTGPGELPDWFAGGIQPNGYFGMTGGYAGDINNDGFDEIFVSEGYSLYGYPELSGKVTIYNGGPEGPSIFESWSYSGANPTSLFGYSVASADVNDDGYDDIITSAENQGDIFAFYGAETGLPLTPSWSLLSTTNMGSEISNAGDVNGDGIEDVLISHPEQERMFVFYGNVDGLSDSNFTTFGGPGYPETGRDHAGVGDVNADGYDDIVVSHGWNRFLLYLGSKNGIITHPSWYVDQPVDLGVILDPNDIAGLGDINHDGFADFIIGSGYQTFSFDHEGAVYVYNGSANIYSTREPDAIFYAGMSDDFNVSNLTGVAAGDVNGDGHGDLLFAFENFDEIGLTDAGKVGLVYGESGMISPELDWSYSGSEYQQYLGASISIAGDVNNDGFGDFLVGSPYMSGVAVLTGKVELFLGSPEGPMASPDWFYEGTQYAERFGSTMCGIGDINGDGYDDVLISSPTYDNGQIDEGKVFLFTGNATGLSLTPVWSFECNIAGANLGRGIGPAGDINNDGFDDILVGAETYFNSPVSQGKAWAFYGSAAGLPTLPSWTMNTTSSNKYLGEEVYAAGDVNSDGYDDVLIGDHAFVTGGLQKGKAYLFYGSNSGLGSAPNWSMVGQEDGEGFGQTARGIGDQNGDGFDDFLIVELYGSFGAQASGAGYLYYGKTGTPSSQFKQLLGVGKSGTTFGKYVANAGDLNNDGLTDFIVQVPGYYVEYHDEYFLFHTTTGHSGGLFLYYNQNGGCNTASGLSVTEITDVSVNANWESDASDFTFRWKLTTDTSWNYTTTTDSFLTLFGLMECSEYEIQISATCFPYGDSEYSSSVFFTTTGCALPCEVPPSGINSTVLSPVKVKLNWDAMLGAVKYNIRYRQVGAISWSNVNSLTTTKTIKGLTPGLTYEYQIRTVCEDGSSPYSTLNYFTTPMRYSETSDLSFKVFPNPANDYCYIYFNPDFILNNITIYIYTLEGKLISSDKNIHGLNSIYQLSISNLPTGSYIIQVINDTQSYSTTIVKQ